MVFSHGFQPIAVTLLIVGRAQIQRKMKRKTFFFCLLLAASCSVALADASSMSTNLTFNRSLQKALLHGNVAYLKNKSQSSKKTGQKTLARLAYLTSQRRLHEVLVEGKACFQSKRSWKEMPLPAYTCGFFAASAALSSQKVAEWARLMVAIKTFDIPAFNQIVGEKWKKSYFHFKTAKDFKSVLPVEVRHGDASGVLAWASCILSELGKPQPVPTILIKVNDKQVCFLVDTGSAFSSLRKRTAKRLGVRLHNGSYGASYSAMSGGITRYHLGIARQMKLGGVQFHNVPFQVKKMKFNIIGNDTLQQLGQLLFTATGLKINPTNPPVCTQPMAFAYDYNSFIAPRGPVLKAVVNGKTVRLLFDSGQYIPLLTNSSSYLKTVNKGFKHKTRIYDYTSSTTAYKTRATFALTEESRPITVKMLYSPVYKDRIPLGAGFGVLEYYNVWLDFDDHTACFLPAR
jgi:hypothetical protein